MVPGVHTQTHEVWTGGVSRDLIRVNLRLKVSNPTLDDLACTLKRTRRGGIQGRHAFRSELPFNIITKDQLF